MKTKNTFLLTALLFCLSWSFSYAQVPVRTYEFKKGEVFDILLLVQKPDTQEALKKYFEDAFPVAQNLSFQSVPGFRVAEHSQGNILPDLLVFGKWENLEKREAFLETITDEVPDFHERRRNIWSYFGLRYYEMSEDFTLRFDKGKLHVATAYWFQPGNEDSNFYAEWKQVMARHGGEILIELEEGISPVGYQYNPDIFVITTWSNEAEFNAFQQQAFSLKKTGMQHVNEFILK